MLFMQRPIEQMAAEVNRYRELYRKHHGREPLPVLCNDFIICDDSAERAEEMARKYIAAYFLTAANHYEMAGSALRRHQGLRSLRRCRQNAPGTRARQSGGCLR